MAHVNINVRDLRFEKSDIGRLIKSSKVTHTWEMNLDENRRKVELVHSKITGKRRISLDGKNIAKDQKFTTEFNYSFVVDKHFISIHQYSTDNYELKIDNISFSSIMNKTRSNDFSDWRSKPDEKKGPEKMIASEIHKIENEFFNTKKEVNMDVNDWNFDENFNGTNTNNTSVSKKKTKEIFFNDNDFDFSGGNKNQNSNLNNNVFDIINSTTNSTTNTNINTNTNVNYSTSKATNSKYIFYLNNSVNSFEFNDIFSNKNEANTNSTVKSNNTNSNNFSLIDFQSKVPKTYNIIGNY